MKEDSPINPPSEKGKVRKAIIDMMMAEIKAGRLEGIVARSADFYGPKNEKSFLVEVVYNNFKKGKAANWFSDLDKKHSFTYTPDAAKATAILGNAPASDWNQVWHLPTNPNTLTGREMAALFAKEMNVKNKVSVLPVWLVKIIGWFIPFMKEMPEMMYQYDRPYFFDSSKFTKRFGLQATSYQEGVKKIVKEG
jgi:nucleoside-diphosphate-sugar epimerase